MAINNWVNYANIPVQKSPLRDIMSDILKGYQLERLPTKIRQEEEARMRDNALKAIEEQFAGPLNQAKLGLLGSQAAQADAAARLSGSKLGLWSTLASQLGNQPSSGTEGPSGGAQSILPGGQPTLGGEQPLDFNNLPTSNPNGYQNSTYETTGNIGEPNNFRPVQAPQQTSSPVSGIPEIPYKTNALGAFLLGMKPNVTEVDGTKYLVTPLGKSKIIEGKSYEQKEFEKNVGKANAEKLTKAIDTIVSLDESNDSLDYIIDTLQKNKSAKDSVGPVNSRLISLFGSDEAKRLFGELSSPSGNIALAAAKNLKGAFTGRDQSLIASVKPNVNDTYDVFVGKLHAMRLLNEVARRKAEIVAEELRARHTPEQAYKRAREEASIEKIRPQIEKLVFKGHVKNALSSKKNNDTVVVYFPDGAHRIPNKLLNEAIKSGATLQRELP